MCNEIRKRDEEVMLFFGATAYLLPVLFARLLGKKVVLEPLGNVPDSLRRIWADRMRNPAAYLMSRPVWLLKRAFWQGYSKRAMETLVPESGDEEGEFLGALLLRFIPGRLRNALLGPSLTQAKKFVMLGVFTACVGLGYLYAFRKW